MTPKVSVILPVYNTEEYLGECLDSLLMQTLENIEVICVDDGSKDDSLSTLQTYAFLDTRLTVVSQEHAGAAAARNKALAEAKGEFVYFANSYDFFESHMFEKMVAQAEMDASDVVLNRYGIVDQVFKQMTQSEELKVNGQDMGPCEPKDLSDELFCTFPAVIWNKLIRMSLIQKYDLKFDESVEHMEDQALNAMVLAGANKISWLNYCYVCHRINLNPHRKVDLAKQFEDGIKVFAHLFHQMEKNALFQEYDIQYYFWLKQFLYKGLDTLTTVDRTRGLKAILKYLPKSVLDHLISPSQYEQKISVIVPVCNAAEFLPDCLNSLINQTLKDIEIICVNDGSTDNSLDILNEFAAKDSRIKVLSQENLGRTVARNKAMEEASGTYIQFVDADDYLAPDACELLYTYARICALDMLSFSAVEFKHKTNEEFEEPYHTLSWLPEKFPKVFMWQMLATDMPKLSVTACLTLYRRMFLLKNNITWMNKKVVFEDTPFFVEAAFNNARMGALKLPCYYRRVHLNATTQQVATHFSDLLFVYKHTLKMLQNMNVPRQIVQAYAMTFFEKVYQNYLRFDPASKEKETTSLYNFCLYMLKTYHLQFSEGMMKWIQAYLKNKKFKKKIKFKWYLFCSKLIKYHYVIQMFELHKLPNFSIRLFSIPLIEIQISKLGLYSMNCKIFGCPFIGVKEVQGNLE